MKYENCPTCNVSWLRKENIIEHFRAEFKKEGIPDYLKEAGFTKIDEAARSVAANYGCTEDALRYFGKNHNVIESENVHWLHCDHCGIAHDESDVTKTTLIFREKELTIEEHS